MVDKYQGHFQYNNGIISNWDSSVIGVYYCGYLDADNKLCILYIGKGVGDNGIRGRLLDHLREDHWPDVTHFGYHICSSADKAENWEAEEIQKYKPQYNKIGK